MLCFYIIHCVFRRDTVCNQASSSSRIGVRSQDFVLEFVLTSEIQPGLDCIHTYWTQCTTVVSLKATRNGLFFDVFTRVWHARLCPVFRPILGICRGNILPPKKSDISPKEPRTFLHRMLDTARLTETSICMKASYRAKVRYLCSEKPLYPAGVQPQTPEVTRPKCLIPLPQTTAE